MIVLHAIWDSTVSGTLHVWAESSEYMQAALVRTRGRTLQEKPRPHPYALPCADLQEKVSELSGSPLVQDAETGVFSLRLPTMAKGPVASPGLAWSEMHDDIDGIALQWWDVPTLRFDTSRALDLLLTLPTHLPHGIVYGSSLRFWHVVAQFAFELITRQCFMPVLQEQRIEGSTTYRAVWVAVLAQEDTRRWLSLAQSMPPVCWSFLAAKEQPAVVLQELVFHFINQSIDTYVRESTFAGSFLPEVRATDRATPAVEQWVRALTSADAMLAATPTSVAQFSTALQRWLDQILPAATEAPFRTCFKLDPPVEGSEETQEREPASTWRISFYLQANDDPSLLIPAENVWQERSSTLTFLKRKFENPQERLLTELGKAARLFPRIDESLKTACPEYVEVDSAQAYTFLRETTPLLEDSGFGVLVPPWWQKASARVGVKLKVRPQVQAQTGLGLMGLNSIVNYNWNIAIGDTTLTLSEFEQLVYLKQPLVNVRGQWVELRSDEIEKAIAFFQKKQARKSITLGDALRIGLGQEPSELGLPVVGLEAEGWIQDVLDRLSQRVQLVPIEMPTTFQGKLRPYQLKGVSWLAFLHQFGFGACLADDMGLGKTAELIALLLYQHSLPEGSAQAIGSTLVICPMSIVGNWQKELHRFAPSLSVMVHHGLERLSGDLFVEEALKHDVVITTYALALRDREHLLSIEWENVVLDEAQNIKNESTKQTQAIKSLNARYKIALTGTPVENRLAELWSIMAFLNPGYLGSTQDFRKNFSLPIERYRNAERATLLKQLIQPFVLRRLKTDKEVIQDLPDKMEMKVFCNLTQEQASLYEAVVKEMLEKIEHAEPMARRGLILATLMKLKQICNHPAQFMSDGSSLLRRSGKLARLEEMLEEVLAEGDKTLIFTQFAEMGTLLRRYLQETLGCEVLFLHGGTPKKQRDLLVQRFQEESDRAQIFILSLKAGGVGLNLTAANHVFHFDRWWNPAVENQATDRAFRIGQKRNVLVHKFVCVGTLEERIDHMIEQKKELAENIVGSGENWLTEMSTAQLKDLFALSREAVGE